MSNRNSFKSSNSGSIWKLAGALALGAVAGFGVFKLLESNNKSKKKEESTSNNEIPSYSKNTTTTNDIHTKETEESIESFLCPISQEIMTDPVVTPEGISYDKKSILQWLSKNKICPLSKKPLKESDLIPNLALKNAIENYLKQSQKQMK
jgi:STIP1 homology and U-box containing protein 1